MGYDVEIVERRREDTAVVRGRVGHGEVGPFIGAALGEVIGAVGHALVTGPPFCRLDMAGDQFELEVGFPVATPSAAVGRVVPSALPGGTTATVLHTGPYEDVAPVYVALEEWLADHGYQPDGAPWEEYLDGPEVAEPRTVVCWPCRREETTPPRG